MLIHHLRVIPFHLCSFRHAVRPDISDVINWYIRMPQPLKHISLRHSVWVNYFIESESSCFTIFFHKLIWSPWTQVRNRGPAFTTSKRHLFVNMYVHVCFCEHVCTCVFLWTCMYMYVFVNMYVHVCFCEHVCTCVFLWTCMYTCVFVNMYVHVCFCEHVCTCVYLWRAFIRCRRSPSAFQLHTFQVHLPTYLHSYNCTNNNYLW
jgi:hypothetical protein